MICIYFFIQALHCLLEVVLLVPLGDDGSVLILKETLLAGEIMVAVSFRLAGCMNEAVPFVFGSGR